jgi:hypothetical protein
VVGNGIAATMVAKWEGELGEGEAVVTPIAGRPRQKTA